MEEFTSVGGRKDVYAFDHSGRVLEHRVVYSRDGRDWYGTVNKFDEKGTRMSEVYKDGKLTERSTTRYNDKGHPIEQVHYDIAEGKSLTVIYRYKYDEAGKILERIRNLSAPLGGSLFGFFIGLSPGDNKDIFTYDRFDNIQSTKSFLPGFSIPVTNMTFTYNAKGAKNRREFFHAILRRRSAAYLKAFL
jgi:hypothetical protein